MFATSTLYGFPVWAVFLGALAPLILATEGGFRGGRRLNKARRQRAKFETGSLQASVLGLLALFLGFTYSASMSNFQERRLLVVKEANAIGTAYLRAQLLPKPMAQQASFSLRRYADLRLQWALADEEQASASARLADAVQQDLWALAVRLAEQDRSAVAGLFIGALNAIIDVGAEREASHRNRIPIQMFGMLCLLAVVAMAITGYGCGIAGDRALAATTIVCALIAAVTVLILNIHEPRQGFVHENLQSLIDARARME
ncbi:hypothetical protein [Methylocapsa aurea]|uniref:bestrophin-like domain n=1 Tax=Methylocapsa aurea TaxID=663610 RepID=UPI000569DD96|nr:hypothetical protein [Methylocapsa aurea]